MPGVERPRRPLLAWVLHRYPNTSRTRAKQWIAGGRVQVDGVVMRKPQAELPNPGDRLKLLSRRTSSFHSGESWAIHPAVEVFHLDPAFAILNKGPGLLSVPAPNRGPSALEILGDFLAGRLKTGEWRVPANCVGLRPLRVHRLDEFTSGLFCMALNPAARAQLISQVKSHSMVREYIAFVEGEAPRAQGVWRDWLSLSANQTRQQVVARPPDRHSQNAQEATTHFEVLAKYRLPGRDQSVTKLRLRLETGLRHQIRVQAMHAGLPLVGERTYRPSPGLPPDGPGAMAFGRQALHAAGLELEHPEQQGVRLRWTAPLPADLRQLEASLERQI